MTLGSFIFVTIVIFIAGVIRGYSGFGFSALTVASLTLIFPPVDIVAIILLMEIFISIFLIPEIIKHIEWKNISLLLIGSIVGTLPGFWVLAYSNSDATRLLSSMIIFFTCMGLIFLTPAKNKAPVWHSLFAGGISGYANGASALVGMPIVLFFLRYQIDATKIRASLIVFFLLSDIFALSLNVNAGFLNTSNMSLLLPTIPALIIAIKLGSWLFKRLDGRDFRPITIGILIFLSLLNAARIIF